MLNSVGGTILYGSHFWPGIAEYREGESVFRIFLNEDTLRKMDRTFAGKPIFVRHVDEVSQNLDVLKTQADGWVVESFYNKSDGKHWAKLVLVSEKAKQCVGRGWKLSNAYTPKYGSTEGGVWNGMAYDKNVIDGEFDHLALVEDPRYNESEILTPEQFKAYNEKNEEDLKRIANSGGESKMLNFFKRTKVENKIDEDVCVTLPVSKKEMKLVDIVNALDKVLNLAGYADMDHMVKMHDGSDMSVKDLVADHKRMKDEMDCMNDDSQADPEDMSIEMENEGKEVEEEEEEDKELEKKKNSIKNEKEKQERIARLKNAKAKQEAIEKKKLQNEASVSDSSVMLLSDKVAKGKAMFGSSKK